MSTQFTVGDKIRWDRGEVTEVINVEGDRMKVRFIKPEKFKGDERWIEGKLFINLKKEKEEKKKEFVKFVKGMTVSWDRKGEKVSGIIEEVKGTGARIKRGPIKQLKDLTPIYNLQDIEKGKRSSQTVFDLIQEIKNKSVEQILKEASERKIDFERDGEGGKFIDNDRSYRGFVYERLWDICIKFGVVDGLTMKNNKTDEREEYNTFHLFGNLNVENIDFKAGSNCWEGGQFKRYLDENIQSGNSGGYSDISFVNKYKNKGEGNEKEDVYFISVKYYEKGKDVGSYDIGKLCTMIEKHNNKVKDRNINILIFVKDKVTLIEKLNKQQKSSDIMMKYIDPKMDKSYPNIYDQKDLEQVIYKLKLLLEQYDYLKGEESINRFSEGKDSYLQILKSPFIPRFHQKLFIDKINELIIKDNEKNILVGAIPRSGKSYIMGGTILDYLDKSDESLKNFLLITPAPTETFGEYRKLFESYIDFTTKGVEPVYLDSMGRSKSHSGKQNKHRVYIASKQLLGWGKDTKENEEQIDDKELKKGELKNIQKELKNIQKYFKEVSDFDLIFLDEAHFGLSTKSAQLILDEINKLSKNAEKTPKIFVTATYNKPSRIYNIKEECKLTWDVNDVQVMKDLTKDNYKENYIRERFGDKIYDNAIISEGGEGSIEKLSSQYSKFPKPYLITSVWDKDYVNSELNKIGSSDYGFDMNELFKNDGNMFDLEENVKVMMRYYFGTPDKNEEYNKQAFYRNRGILPRIKRICSNNCRTLQSNSRFKTSQLWFLPYGPGNKIAGVVTSLLNLLNSKNEFNDIKKSYHFYVAVEDDSWKGKKGKTFGNVTYMDKPSDIRDDIESVEKQISDGELKGDNLIILAGARLQLGISFVNVDIVALWNTVNSSDANFQMLFRSMTERSSYEKCKDDEYCGNKKFGFMVDLNPQRALTNLFLFQDTIRNKNKQLTDKERNIELSKIINIDDDVMQDKFSGDENKRDDFINELFNKFYTSWDNMTKTVQKTAKSFSYNKDILKSIEKELRNVKIAPTKALDTIVDPKHKLPGVKKPSKPKTKKQIKNEKKVLETPIEELAAEALADIIALMNIYTIYLSEKANCILVEDKIIPEVVSDIGELKNKIWGEEELKRDFLETLNKRLGGFGDEKTLEKIIDTLKVSITSDEDLISMNRLIMTQKKQIYTIREPDKLLEYINDNLAPKEKEIGEHGEVFTPIYLVNEMLDKLPKNVWSDHKLKWLDPAAGIGNFPICIYLRLMEGLKSWKPNKEKRREHILENMIYMGEINKKNYFILEKIFCSKGKDKKNNGYNLKLNKGDSLKWLEKLKRDGNIFNIVVGNPPYNTGGKGKEGDKSIWIEFITKSLNILQNNGYMGFIVPALWRSRGSGGEYINDILTNLEITHIRPYNLDEVQKVFSGTQKLIDYFVLKNTKNNKKLVNIKSIFGEEDVIIKPGTNIPNIGYNILYNIKNKHPEIGYLDKVTRSSFEGEKVIKKQNVLMIQHSSNGKNVKVEKLTKPNDDKFYLIKNVNKNIEFFFKSKVYRFLSMVCLWSGYTLPQAVFGNINDFRKVKEDLKTDEDIYKYYGIKKEEQKLIEEVVDHVKPIKRTPKNKQTIKGEFGSNPKYANFKDSDLLPEGFEPEPEQDPEAPRVINKSRTKKKSKSKSKEKKKKQTQTQTKKKGGRRKNKRTTRKRRR